MMQTNLKRLVLQRSLTTLKRSSSFPIRAATRTKIHNVRISSALAIPCGIMACNSPQSFYSSCEAAIAVPEETTTLAKHAQRTDSRWKEIKKKARHALRMLARVVKLSIALFPLFLFYPIQLLTRGDVSKDAHQVALAGGDAQGPGGAMGWYLQLCLACVEWSGAAVIKLMQWAGSRPDLFGSDFCSVFSRLQDDTTPHKWKHTERALREAYGDDWEQKIQVGELLGSGCIGQVYKGAVKDSKGRDMEVAIKIMHPGVHQDIDTDLDLMRVAARWFPRLPGTGHLVWLNLEGAVEEFAEMLLLQLDLRTEAANLKRFNKNFKGDKHVLFPKLINGYPATRDVLIETFCEGIPVTRYAKEFKHEKEILHDLCYIGIEAVCKMIFLDNFMHGDLHPGNVFVNPKTRKFVILDCGIVTEYTDEDHQLIVDILTSFIRFNGRRAGRLLIDDSNRRLHGRDSAQNEEEYIDKIEALTIRATGKDYFMEHLGTYISYICEAAATHHVLMNESFVSAMLAVKVQEGIALALDPSVEIYKVSNPIILESEARRKVKQWQRKIAQAIFGKDSQIVRKFDED